MNVDDGNIGWYKYDQKDSSIQRYDSSEIDELSKINHKYLMSTLVMSGTSLLLLIAIIILMIKLRNIKR